MRLWSSGFELQSVTAAMEFDTITGSPTISTTIKRNGGASLKCAPSALTCYIGHTYDAGGSSNSGLTYYARFYIYIKTSTSGLASILVLRDSNNGNNTVSIRLNTDRTLELWSDGYSIPAQIGSNSSSLDAETWYRVELSATSDLASTTVTAYLNGVSFASGTFSTTADWPNLLRLGCVTSTTAELYFDDIAVNDSSGSYQTGLPGAGSIAHIYPNAAGDIDQTTDTPNGYLKVDEYPTPDDATSYVVFAANNNSFLVKCQSSATAGISADSITLVQVGYRHRSASASAYGFTPQIESQASGTLLSGTAWTQNNTTWHTNGNALPRIYKLTSYVDPQAGGSWTTNLLDTTQIGGICTDAVPNMWLSSMWALVEYIPTTVVPLNVDIENPKVWGVKIIG